MSIFDQMKQARELMKDMSPEKIRELQSQAQQAQKMMDDMITKKVEEEITRRGLVTREEVKQMIDNIQ